MGKLPMRPGGSETTAMTAPHMPAALKKGARNCTEGMFKALHSLRDKMKADHSTQQEA